MSSISDRSALDIFHAKYPRFQLCSHSAARDAARASLDGNVLIELTCASLDAPCEGKFDLGQSPGDLPGRHCASESTWSKNRETLISIKSEGCIVR